LQSLIEKRIETVPTLTVGICATGRSDNLPFVLDQVSRAQETGFEIQKIVVVASRCGRQSLQEAKQIASRDGRIVIIEESERRGKAEAINRIIDAKVGDYLLFVNADALPESGAITFLVDHLITKPWMGVVSACPQVQSVKRFSATTALARLLWAVHNQSSLCLNHLGVSNHTNDEMMAMRSELVEKLPPGLVNDGAFLASRIKTAGYSVGFSDAAIVRISTPQNFFDFVSQRRRIIFGHFQIWKMLRKTPITVESMLLSSPILSLSIIVRTMAKEPRSIFALPLMGFVETVSSILALADFSRSSQRHSIWKRFDS
jgi:cellulose synthase/poly-beta-1,6-N-acetylglucosamine synthase-like glycosyltransferase